MCLMPANTTTRRKLATTRRKLVRREHGYDSHLILLGFFYVWTPGVMLRVRVGSHNYYAVLDDTLEPSVARGDTYQDDSRLSIGYYDQG